MNAKHRSLRVIGSIICKRGVTNGRWNNTAGNSRDFGDDCQEEGKGYKSRKKWLRLFRLRRLLWLRDKKENG